MLLEIFHRPVHQTEGFVWHQFGVSEIKVKAMKAYSHGYESYIDSSTIMLGMFYSSASLTSFPKTENMMS